MSTRRLARIIREFIYLLGLVVVGLSLNFPEFAKEIIIGVISSILIAIAFEREILKPPKPSPEETSRLSLMEKDIKDVKSSLSHIEESLVRIESKLK